MGRPGVDFPVLPHIPRTEFSCRKIKKSGYYADLETGCQVFHICDGGRKISFLCPNGTIFRQSHLICDWWFRVDCERSVELYDESAEQLAHDQMVYKKRAEEIARVMKTSTVPPVTEKASNFRGTRRKNERLSEKLVDLNTANLNSFSSNQLSDATAPAPSSYSETSQTFSSQPGPSSGGQGPAFVSNPTPVSYSEQSSKSHIGSQASFNPQAAALSSGQASFTASQSVTRNQPSFSGSQGFTSQTTFMGNPASSYQVIPNPAPPAPQTFTKQINAQFVPQSEPQVFSGTPNGAPTFSGSYIQNTNPNPSAQQANFAQSLKTGEQVYQQANADFKNLGLGSNDPSAFPPTGNTNYKFSYSSSSSSQSQTTSGFSPPKDFTNNQVFSHQAYPQEKERQVLAETASFASNRHRFSNQLEQAYYQANAFTATPATPSTDSYPSSTIRNDANSFNSGPARNQNKKTDFNGFKPSSDIYNIGPTNNFYSQQKTPPTTQAPYTTKTINRGSQTYQSSINQGSNQYQTPVQSSTTTTAVPNPTTPQVYNSHMQPYSSLNQVPNGNTWSNVGLKSTAAPTFPTSGIDNYKGESSSQFSSYNTVNAAHKAQTLKSFNQLKTPSSTAKPQRGKTVFTVRIKPNKDYSLLELQRVRPTNTPSSTTFSSSSLQPIVVTGQPPYGPSQRTPPNTPASTHYTTTPVQTSSYLNIPHKYATVNITGTPEEIRPEIVNSLMDAGIKPTAANSLHTFASYYESGENDDSLEAFTTARGHVSDLILNVGSTSTESEIQTTTVKPITSTNGNELPSELSKMTKDSYSFLFSQLKELQEQKDDLTPKESGSAISDLSKKAQKQAKLGGLKPTKTPETTTIKPEEFTPKIRDSAELRELAQVFSRALSAYLEDPETFKEILAQVRPTEPNPTDNTTPNPDDEVLDFSDASQSRTGTTEPPGTTIFNADDVTGDISIGQINNLVSSKSVEADNSYETNSISPFASQSISDVEFTTLAPTVTSAINSVPSASSDYYSKAGTVEDTSYFPTAGAVNDNSRPRYGGFQNNTRRVSNSYSPYGADLRNNVTTGTPITERTTLPSTTYQPPTTTVQYPTLNIETTTLQPPSSILPAAQQVNSLVASHNLLYGTSAQFTSSSEEDFGSLSSNEHEKLLLTSGSQSLVSSQNYASFAQNFNKNGQKLYGKDSYTNYAPSAIAEDPSSIGGDYSKGDYLPYFGQEPPFETISQPSAFQTPTPHFGDKIPKNHSSNVNTQANKYTIQSQNLVLDETKIMSDRMGVAMPMAGAESTASVTWTASPYETTVSSSVSSVPVNKTPVVIKPTTYHPSKLTPDTTTVPEPLSESTTAVPTTTLLETTTTEAVWPTTMTPDMENAMMQSKAKEMFGMLNETAASMLMEVMAMAENNMTLRRLVLLLFNDPNKDKTAEQSRANLINALLTHENDIEELTSPQPTTPPTTTAQATTPKKKVMKIMRVRTGSRSLKLQRAVDSQTAVAGSNTIRTNVTDYNKANAAKLYIPSGPPVPAKPTTQRPPTTTLQPKLPYDSDARALELLKTLYNLAAKWG